MLSHRVIWLGLLLGATSVAVISSRETGLLPMIVAADRSPLKCLGNFQRFISNQKPSITVKLHMAHPTVPMTDDDDMRNADLVSSGDEWLGEKKNAKGTETQTAIIPHTIKGAAGNCGP